MRHPTCGPAAESSEEGDAETGHPPPGPGAPGASRRRGADRGLGRQGHRLRRATGARGPTRRLRCRAVSARRNTEVRRRPPTARRVLRGRERSTSYRRRAGGREERPGGPGSSARLGAPTRPGRRGDGGRGDARRRPGEPRRRGRGLQSGGRSRIRRRDGLGQRSGRGALDAGGRRRPERGVGHRGRSRRCRGGREEVEWIAVGVVRTGIADAEVQVGSIDGALPGAPDRSETGARRDVLAGTDLRGRQVEVGEIEAAVRGPHGDRLTGRSHESGELHLPRGRREDGRAVRSGDVDPAMLAGGVRVVPVAVVGQDLTEDGPSPVSRRERG